MLTRRGVARLNRLIEFMENQPREMTKHFYMGSWFDNGKIAMVPGSITKNDLHKCGTTACAFGFAATMPYFRRLGLRVSTEGFPVFHGAYYPRDRAWFPAKEIFDLDRDHVSTLFGPSNPAKTPKQWAKNARIFLVRELEAEKKRLAVSRG